MDNLNLVVIDQAGNAHGLAWLQATYGAGINVQRAVAPCWRLMQVTIEATGNTSMHLWLKDATGLPKSGQPVTYSYPKLGDAADLGLAAIPTAFISRWAERGVLNKNLSDGNGHVEFQIGSESWIKQGRGPYAAWVLDTKYPSDCIDGIGWMMGTEHWGPVNLIFQLIAADVVVPPDPVTGPLPEQEPILPLGQLADKVRWWLEESVRQDEAGQGERATAIRYSLIKLNGGLLYRLENALKSGALKG